MPISATFCGKCRKKCLYFRVERKWLGKVIVYECRACGYRFTRRLWR